MICNSVRRRLRILLACGCLLLAAHTSVAGQVRGRACIPAIAGSETQDRFPLRGAALFACPADEAPGIACYCPDAEFAFTVAPGSYCALLEPAEPYRRGQVFCGLRIGEEPCEWNLELTPDYNCIFTTLTDWRKDPWAWGTVFEQTFVARGTSITHVALKLAGIKQKLGETTLGVSIRDRSDKPVGPLRRITAKAIDDLYVAWPSGEVPTEPGRTYTLRVADIDGKKPVGLFVRRDYGYGYAYGELMVDDARSETDGYFYIGANADGTILTHDAPSQAPAGAARQQWSRFFVARGTSLAGVSVPLIADAPPVELAIAVHRDNTDGPRVGTIRKMKPVPFKDKRWLVGAAFPRGGIPLEPKQTYALVVASADRLFATLAVDGAPAGEADFAVRLYEHAAEKLDFELPPPPEPLGWEFADILATPNSGFEKGDQSSWENAWGGGDAFTAVVGADYKPDRFSGDARRPHSGEYCAVIASQGDQVRKLIRRRFDWPHTAGKGLFHARVWVASSDNADKLEHPLTVRLCVSDHGSIDAGNVVWSRPVVSPGRWTMFQCRPEVPKTRNLTAFLLIEGGAENEQSYLKIDDLEIVVDEK